MNIPPFDPAWFVIGGIVGIVLGGFGLAIITALLDGGDL